MLRISQFTRRSIVIAVLVLATLGSLLHKFDKTYASPSAVSIPVTFTIDTTAERLPISPYIYGTNQDLTGTERWTLRRIGGNRMTGYNWENNASNAGSDWQQSSDDFMCGAVGVPTGSCTVPGAVLTAFHDKSLQMGAESLVTLQMAGYVAKDKNGTVSTTEVAPSARWDPVVNVKGSAFSNPPSLTDNAVYMDEELAFLVGRYGNALAANGIMAYDLDNEPALWSNTHPRIHPAQPTAVELLTKSTALAKAIKGVDANALVFGPVAYGFAELNDFQTAPDWASVKGTYAWFVDYYLAEMKKASDASGKRLLDAFDFHWYPEAQGGGQRIVFGGTGSLDTQKARVQAPRTLWDPTYLETSWIASCCSSFLPLLPRIQKSIDTYYPGTKIAITEFTYGGEGDVSGGIAMVDALGIYGKYGIGYATFWQVDSTTTYVTAAYKLYRNYNGSNGTYGDTKVKANTSDVANTSVYASVTAQSDAALHVIALNKSFDTTTDVSFNITSMSNYTSARVWGFNQASATISELAPIATISGNKFTYSIPPLTALHIVLSASTTATNTPVPPTKTNTPGGPTPSNTPIPPTKTNTPVVIPTNTSVVVPTNTAVPPTGGLVTQIKSNGAETNQQTPFAFTVKNTSTSAKSGISVRIYFNTDNGNAGSNYTLEKYYDQSGVATIVAPTLVSGSTYYFTVNYGTASLAAGAQWEFQTALHLSNWGTNYDGTNDHYHTGYALNALPAAYTNTNYIPAYVSGTLVWGVEPGGSPAPTATTAPATNTPVPPTKTNTPAAPTATRTNTPVGPTATTAPATNTPVPPTKTNTPAAPTATRTNTPVGQSATPNASDPCASPTVITSGGTFAVGTTAKCFKYVNATFTRGGMFSVMKDGTSTTDTLKWYGGLDQNVTACSNQTATITGNGGQLNNFTVAKDGNGQMFLTITGAAANNVTISITNWQNGNGCSVVPTVHP